MELSLKGSSKKKYYIMAFAFGCLPFLLSALSFIVKNNGAFYLYNDFNTQQIPFYLYIIRNIKNGYFPQFDFNNGAGLDYINAYTFYNLFSPFTFLYALIPYRMAAAAMPFVMSLKFGCCALFAYIYISRFCKTPEYAAAGGILYAYSGAVMVNLVLPYLDSMALFPLLLAALESAVKDKRRGVFGAAVFICAVTQYYIFGMEAVFLIIYFLVHLTDKSFHINIKDFFCLALETVLGLAASGIALIPAAVYMLNSPRLGEPFGSIKDMLIYPTPWRYARILQSIFMMPDLQGYTNFFPDGGVEYPSGSRWSSQAMYIPVFGMAGAAAYISANRKNSFSKLFIILILIAFIPVLNGLFSMGSSIYYARWMFTATLIICMMTACALENEPTHFKTGIIIQASATAAIALFSIIFPIEKLSLWKTNVYWNNVQKWTNITITAIGVIIAFLSVFRVSRDASYPRNILITAAVFAFIVSESVLFFDMGECRSSLLYESDHSGQANSPSVSYDENESRVDTDETLWNHNLLWNKGSSYCFTSIQSKYTDEFCKALMIDAELSGNYPAQCLMSAKELIMYDTEPDPDSFMLFSSSGYQEFKDNYTAEKEENNFEYYENKNFIHMGFCYEYCISEEDYLALDKDIRRSLMMKVMAVDDVSAVSGYLEPIPEEEIYALDDEEFAEECAKRAEKTALSYYTDDNSYNAEIDLAEPELVFFSVAYDEGFTAYVDGEEVPLYNANFGFQAIPVPAGKHTIKCVYHSKWRDIGAVSSIIGISGLIIYTAVCFVIKKKRNV